jgi:hypothetical protein
VKFTQLTEESLITVPESLLNSSNVYAQMAAGQIGMANTMSMFYSAFSEIPQGATKSSQPIVPSNARVASSNYLVYTWSYEGFSYANQLQETSNKYILEIFFKIQGSDWLRLLYADQSKDRKSGQLKFFDLAGEGELIWTYTWAIEGNVQKCSLFDEYGNKIYTEVDKVNGAGKVELYEYNKLYLIVTWTAQGSGTWTSYDGDKTTSGTWN